MYILQMAENNVLNSTYWAIHPFNWIEPIFMGHVLKLRLAEIQAKKRMGNDGNFTLNALPVLEDIPI